MRIDKYYTKPIVWDDKTLTDSNSEQYEILSYEAMRAVNPYLFIYSVTFFLSNIFENVLIEFDFAFRWTR